LYASLIGFHPRRLKVPTGDELPRNGLRSMRHLLLLLIVLRLLALQHVIHTLIHSDLRISLNFREKTDIST